MLWNKKWLWIFSRVFILVTLLGVGIPMESRAMPIPQTSESDWPMLQHDVRHSGYTSVAFVPPDYEGTLNVRWKVGLGERVEMEMQPIVAYGRVYVGVMNGKLHAIDEETGEIEWTYQAGGAISHTPAASEGKVFFGTEDHKVYALNAETGEVVYEERVTPRRGTESVGIVYSSVTAADGKLYAVSQDNGAYVLAAKPEFEQLAVNVLGDDDSRTNATIAVSDNQLIMRTDKAVYCIGQ